MAFFIPTSSAHVFCSKAPMCLWILMEELSLWKLFEKGKCCKDHYFLHD
ncbi:hypothetical protein GLYMA_05G164000v4 [Glycine max]|uniref:Uncharacterized protein n=1 Tax=Glycine max TaxID=3847 RepID=A0A0R0JWI4_SOYBN|nr:hypothetical protein GLYMA_05G164000v4 [Glycine max]